MSTEDTSAAKAGYAGGQTSKFQDAIHDNVDRTSAATSGTLSGAKNLLDKDGAVGKQFKADGAIGNEAQEMGGVFSKDGAVGKQFTQSGSIGGTVQEHIGEGTTQDASSGETISEKVSRMLRPGDSMLDQASNVGKTGITDGAVGREIKIGNPFHTTSTTSTTEGSVQSTIQEAQGKLEGVADKAKDTTGVDDGGAFRQQEGVFEKSVFDKTGAVGKEFEAGGTIGSTAESLGGPFSKEGAIGKEFASDGSIGSRAQQALGNRK